MVMRIAMTMTVCLFLHLLLLVVVVAGASSLDDDLNYETTFKLPVVKSTKEAPINVQSSSHYGNPNDGCAADEQTFHMADGNGDFCAPPCTTRGQCPTDIPKGVTAIPQCLLADKHGKDYCALMCDPYGKKPWKCGSNGAKCSTIPQQLIGICTFDKEHAGSGTTRKQKSASEAQRQAE